MTTVEYWMWVNWRRSLEISIMLVRQTITIFNDFFYAFFFRPSEWLVGSRIVVTAAIVSLCVREPCTEGSWTTMKQRTMMVRSSHTFLFPSPLSLLPPSLHPCRFSLCSYHWSLGGANMHSHDWLLILPLDSLVCIPTINYHTYI